jgi:multiple sugar transport system permease protein
MLRRTALAKDFSVLALPALAVYFAVVLIPIVISILQSFTDMRLIGTPSTFVGLDNFAKLAGSAEFGRAFRNTLLVTAVVTVVPNAAGIALALLLDRPTRMFAALRSLLFIPVVLSSVVVSFIWQVILTQRGVANSLLGGLGIPPIGWIQDPAVAIWSIGIVVAWSLTGLCVVTYLAALQTVPGELVEASRIDGAGPVQTFRYVVWPGVAPALTLNTVVLMISGFKLYDHVVVLTGGGPAGATETVTTLLLQTSFEEFRTGYASAMAVVLLIAVLLTTTLSLRLLQRREVQV